LAREWEEKLLAQQKLQEDYQRFCHQQPRVLSADEREAIRQLAENIPALWHATTTTDTQRKEIIRQVVNRVLVNIEGDSERVQVTIEWVGGAQTQGIMIRPVAKLTQLSFYPQLCERIRSLASAGLSAVDIACQLNQEGYHPPKRRQHFDRQGVQDLMHRLGLRQPRSRSQEREGLEEHEWWVSELARTIGMPDITLYDWVRRGWVKARQQQQPPQRWIVWADETEIERLRQYRQRPASDTLRQRWL